MIFDNSRNRRSDSSMHSGSKSSDPLEVLQRELEALSKSFVDEIDGETDEEFDARFAVLGSQLAEKRAQIQSLREARLANPETNQHTRRWLTALSRLLTKRIESMRGRLSPRVPEKNKDES
jgi:hypothetical protein